MILELLVLKKVAEHAAAPKEADDRSTAQVDGTALHGDASYSSEYLSKRAALFASADDIMLTFASHMESERARVRKQIMDSGMNESARAHALELLAASHERFAGHTL